MVGGKSRHQETSKSKHPATIAGKVQAGALWMVASTSRTLRSNVITIDSVRAWFKEHQDQFIVLPCQKTHLT
ncbi:hypothetical protein TNCV_2114311 [Trichonephila clavipes]|nr:hypothetical protein TNCV_2114311 [Trichonephila clavipes]